MQAMSTRIWSWRAVSRAGLVLVLVGLLPLGAVAAAAGGDAVEELVQVDINQQGLDETVLMLKDKGGELYAAIADIKRWRLRAPDVTPLSWKGEAFYPLKAIAGLNYHEDAAQGTLAITAPATAFLPSSIGLREGQNTLPLATKPATGGFLNYDLFAERSAQQTTQSGVFEAGLFNRYGVGVGSVLVQDGDSDRRFVRLDTTWTQDRPAQLASLRLGDTIGVPGIWGRAVRFGGLQYATNFATQPGFVTLPLQGVAGQAALPSTVDVYVNNALASTKDVAPGPFAITNVPVVTGSGDVRVVVRDLLGREQVITQPFYASTTLLARGLNDFAWEAGTPRQNYGLTSNDYGPWFVSTTQRHGFSDSLTGEARAEVQGEQQTLGLGGAWLASTFGVFTAAFAASHSDDGAGTLEVLGFERQARVLSLGLRTQQASQRFTQLGLAPGAPAPARVSSASISVATGRFGSLGLAMVMQDDRVSGRLRLLSASYDVSLRRWGFLNTSLSKTLGAGGGLSLSATVTVPLGERTTAMGGVTRQRGHGQTTAEVQQGLPAGDGIGYVAQWSDNGPRRAGLSAQNGVGTYSAEVAENQGQTGTRFTASGGLALLDGLHWSRRITDSFAVVQVPGYANVRVYADNQLFGRTDADGKLLLPRLRAYEKNPVSIEQLDLPLDATVGALALNAVPYYRSGMVLDFPVTQSRGAQLVINLDNGQHLPAGAVVSIEGQSASFPVGHDGEVYLTGLSSQNRLHVEWRQQHCDIALRFPETPDPLPNLGTFICRGVQP